MKKVLTIFFSFFIVILESTALQNLKLMGVMPNLSLVFVMSIALNSGSRCGRWTGFLTGLAQDVLLCPYIGFYTLFYFLLGHISGQFHRILRGSSLFTPLLLMIGGDLIYGIVSFIFRAFLQGQTDLSAYFKWIILPEAAYTAFFALPVYAIVFYLGAGLDKLKVKNMITRKFAEEEGPQS